MHPNLCKLRIIAQHKQLFSQNWRAALDEVLIWESPNSYVIKLYPNAPTVMITERAADPIAGRSVAQATAA